jgi:carboxyl-terminal processing protease
MLGRVSAQNGSYQQLSIFMEVLNRIQSDYVDEPSINTAVTGAIRGLIENIDPYGGYLTPQEVAFYKDFDQEKSPGIGAVLARRFGYPVLVSVTPGGPADKAKLGTGDMIEAIDGVTTREMNIVQVNSLLANPAGKPVSLSIIRRRSADPETISLMREVVKPAAVEAKIVESDIAYIRVPYLGTGKAAEARRQLDALLKRGATNVILDLRTTTGVIEQEAVDLASTFIDNGTVGYLQGQKVDKKLFMADPKVTLTKAPLVVLINQGTAGNAELVAGAIADSKRGQLVGTRTFGAGSVQRLIPMEEGYALLISVAKYYTPTGKDIQYYTPTGKDIQEVGVKPDVEQLAAGEEQIDPTADDQQEIQAPTTPQAIPQAEEDKQLNKAIELLHKPGAARKAA